MLRVAARRSASSGGPNAASKLLASSRSVLGLAHHYRPHAGGPT